MKKKMTFEFTDLADLEKQIDEFRQNNIKLEMLRNELILLIDKWNIKQRTSFTIKDIFGETKERRLSVAKYHNPDNPSQTWTGMGRKPNWLIGKTITKEMLINPNDTIPIPSKKKRKPQTSDPADLGLKQPLKIKYVNPQNIYQRWSGRGPMPKWLREFVAAGKSKDDFLVKETD